MTDFLGIQFTGKQKSFKFYKCPFFLGTNPVTSGVSSSYMAYPSLLGAEQAAANHMLQMASGIATSKSMVSPHLLRRDR
jgi:hypothetical protein